MVLCNRGGEWREDGSEAFTRGRQSGPSCGPAEKKEGGKGGHVNIKMPNGQIITSPIHGELKIGLLKAPIRKAGLTDEEFMAAL